MSVSLEFVFKINLKKVDIIKECKFISNNTAFEFNFLLKKYYF